MIQTKAIKIVFHCALLQIMELKVICIYHFLSQIFNFKTDIDKDVAEPDRTKCVGSKRILQYREQ